jgi:hypothetical protein
MTSNEWYELFCKELRKVISLETPVITYTRGQVLEVARKVVKAKK